MSVPRSFLILRAADLDPDPVPLLRSPRRRATGSFLKPLHAVYRSNSRRCDMKMGRMVAVFLLLQVCQPVRAQSTGYSLTLTSSGKIFHNTGTFPDGFQVLFEGGQPLTQNTVAGNPPPSISLPSIPIGVNDFAFSNDYSFGTVSTECVIQSDIMYTNYWAAAGVALRFRVLDSLTYYSADYSPLNGGNGTLTLWKYTGGNPTALYNVTGVYSANNTWFNLEVRAIGSSLRLYFNHTLRMSFTDTSFPAGLGGMFAMLCCGGDNSWFFDNVKVFKSHSIEIGNLETGQKVELYDQSGTARAIDTVGAGSQSAFLDVSALDFPFAGYFKVYDTAGVPLTTSAAFAEIWGGDVYRYSSTLSIQENAPVTLCLRQNYPNPFNPNTTIKYELPKSSKVRLSVYDLLGREVTVLLNERQDAGVHEVKFDGSNLASGVYLCKLQAGEFVQTRKLLLVR
jgi:hypothetical protein